MGRDVTGLRFDNKKPNMKPNGVALDRVHVAPKVSVEKVETKEHEVDNQNAKGTINEDSREKQEVLGVKSTNTETGMPEGKTKSEALKHSEKKLSSPLKPAPETTARESFQTNSSTSHSPELSNEERASLPNSPLTARKLLHSNGNKKHHDEEDNYSLASSAATSVRTIRNKVTVGVAPSFKSAERAQRRKEYYMKLEEKHKALEAEKQEYAARTKEEEAAAIQQLRKSMIVKANPVPSFYREGPPPKVELKKLPVTRAKSPNFTRRKSCSDAIKKSSPDEKKATAVGTRHSIGVYRGGSISPVTPKIKDLSGTRNFNGPSKFKDSNGTPKPKARPNQVKDTKKALDPEQMSTDIPVVTETKHLHANTDEVANIALVEEETKTSVMTEQESADDTVIELAPKASLSATEQRTADVVVHS